MNYENEIKKLMAKNRLLTLQIIAVSARHLDACDSIGESNELSRELRKRVIDNADTVCESIGINRTQAISLICDYQMHGVIVQDGCGNIH